MKFSLRVVASLKLTLGFFYLVIFCRLCNSPPLNHHLGECVWNFFQASYAENDVMDPVTDVCVFLWGDDVG